MQQDPPYRVVSDSVNVPHHVFVTARRANVKPVFLRKAQQALL